MTTDEAVEIILDWTECETPYKAYLNRSSVNLVLSNFGQEHSCKSLVEAAKWCAKQPEYLKRYGK